MEKLELIIIKNKYDLGEDKDNYKYLGEGLKSLVNLKHLNLNLSCNKIGIDH